MKYEVTAVVAGLTRTIDVEAISAQWARQLAKQEFANVATNYSIQDVRPVGATKWRRDA